jgi:prepilin-type N-terminal cleavage/methylation domain-containing protein
VRRGGFSLAELLIVIGIVALLAALLFPVIQNAREGGRRTQCLAQMHQLGQSVLAYLADFNETYPMAAYVQHYTHNSTCLFTLYHELVPYIRDKRIVVCPSDGRPVNVARAFAAFMPLCPAMGFEESSYMANWCLFEVGVLLPWLPQPHRVITASAVEYPEQTVAFFDAVMVPPPSLMPLVQGRHHEVAVANFADGHSRPLRTRRTSMTVSRADGGTAHVYCLLEVGPYYSGDGLCVETPYGLASQRRDGSWCRRCPGRPRESRWYIPSNCGDS